MIICLPVLLICCTKTDRRFLFFLLFLSSNMGKRKSTKKAKAVAKDNEDAAARRKQLPEYLKHQLLVDIANNSTWGPTKFFQFRPSLYPREDQIAAREALRQHYYFILRKR